jgi:hypothetical protein
MTQDKKNMKFHKYHIQCIHARAFPASWIHFSRYETMVVVPDPDPDPDPGGEKLTT